MSVIEHNCHGDAENITMEIMREWLNRKGTEISWKNFIKTLRKCKIKFVADQIEMATEKLQVN